jgi:TetR/AcrR family transcriptional regulator
VTNPPREATEAFRNLREDKQERIFRSAVEEFASRGYRNASMNSLVKSAEISKGSLFLYFKTKGDLFNGIVDIAVARVKGYLKQTLEDTADMDFFQRLEELIMSGFAFIDTHPGLARIYFRVLQSGEAPFGSERLLSLQALGRDLVADLISGAVEKGELRPDMDVKRVAFLLNALLERLLRSYYTEHLDSGLGIYRGDSEELRRWVETTVDLVRRGTGNPQCRE